MNNFQALRTADVAAVRLSEALAIDGWD